MLRVSQYVSEKINVAKKDEIYTDCLAISHDFKRYQSTKTFFVASSY